MQCVWNPFLPFDVHSSIIEVKWTLKHPNDWKVCLVINSHCWTFESLNCQLIKHSFNSILKLVQNYNLIIIIFVHLKTYNEHLVSSVLTFPTNFHKINVRPSIWTYRRKAVSFSIVHHLHQLKQHFKSFSVWDISKVKPLAFEVFFSTSTSLSTLLWAEMNAYCKKPFIQMKWMMFLLLAICPRYQMSLLFSW